MQKTKCLIKKVTSVVLAMALVLPVAGFAKTSVAAEEDATTALLKEFAAKQTFLGADTTKTYDGLLKRTTDENAPHVFSNDNIPLAPIGYRIDDFDGDGANELLIVDLTEKTIEKKNTRITELVMYEVVDSAVVEKDRVSLPVYEEEDGNYYDNGLSWSEGDSACITYVQEGKRYIAVEEYNVATYIADGIGWDFLRLTYDGTEFAMAGKYALAGSDIAYDETRYYAAMELRHAVVLIC